LGSRYSGSHLFNFKIPGSLQIVFSGEVISTAIAIVVFVTLLIRVGLQINNHVKCSQFLRPCLRLCGLRVDLSSAPSSEYDT
jgi:hypothetical protein